MEYFCNLIRARLQVGLGHAREAASFIPPALERDRERGLVLRVADLSIMPALIDERLGNSCEALQHLENAFVYLPAAGSLG
jgi:hypothetical protein